jgi:pyrimidine-nucleoside phosphorylase
MAICFTGMTPAETADLTLAMAETGETLGAKRFDQNDYAPLPKIVDKHSTGGVGDKTTLAVAPSVAACGVPVAKMSGRGLGHTGGTIDKLEGLPGFRFDFTREEFAAHVQEHGICIASQSASLAPADKKIYSLRDVTATVDSIPLIAASIMSKKIAAGADAILLDVKAGSGAFMKDVESARQLAQTMVQIGNDCGRQTAALITNMDTPPGYTIGNLLEVGEVIKFLANALERTPLTADFIDITKELSAAMLFLAGKGKLKKCRNLVEEAISTGAAMKKFEQMLIAQGANGGIVYTESQTAPVTAPQSGYISHMNAEGIGICAMMLGAGRELPTDEINHSAGIILHAKTGMFVEAGQKIADLKAAPNFTNFPAVQEKFLSCVSFSPKPPRPTPPIHEFINL